MTQIGLAYLSINKPQAQKNDCANQNNPNNKAHRANQNNHANQCNPNNAEYHHVRSKNGRK